MNEQVKPFDAREQRVLPMPVSVEYPETAASRAAARLQQRKDRAEVIAEPDDPERAIDARLLIDALVEDYGADRVHRWVRSAALIRGGSCPCLKVGGRV